MLIDWFTVIAQIVNFLVLVGLMKHFLYGRLVGAIDAREQRIAAKLAETDRKNREAQEALEASRAETERLEHQKAQVLADAKQQAEAEHGELLRNARETVKALEAKWREDLDRDKAAFFDEIRARAANEILAISRRALADLASTDLEQSAIDAFLKKLQTLEPEHLGAEIVVRSGTLLQPEAVHRIENALHQRLGDAIRLRFERAPQMTWGLELRTNGRRIGWNPETYVGSLEEHLRAELEHRGR